MNKQNLIGIDLGTSFSVVARLDDLGRPQTIPNAEGELTTPSAVFFGDDETVVGSEAIKAATLNPSQVVQFAKRQMGSPAISQRIHGESLPPEVVQALILERLKNDAEQKLGPLDGAVVTVPAYFDEPRRKATQDAGLLAGLNVIDIINEPTAAAIAYGVQEGFLTQVGEAKQPETIVVYDLGGGTFDVTLMRIDGQNYEVLATDGDVMLGGIDWNQCLLGFLAEQFLEKHGFDPRQEEVGFQRLQREAEDAKRALSVREKTTASMDYREHGLRTSLTRQQFDAMSAHLLNRTQFTLENLLAESGMQWGDVTRVLLVGGSTRMPMVVEMIERVSGKTPDRSLSADEAVAHGAAIYAGLLRNTVALENRTLKVTNVNSHNLGIIATEQSTGRRRNRVMISKNTSLPARTSAQFKTARQGQANVAVPVVEGGDELTGNGSTPIGTFLIQDVPEDLPAGTLVEVAFEYAANGRLSIDARIPSIHRTVKMEVERQHGLSESQLAAWRERIAAGMPFRRTPNQKVDQPVMLPPKSVSPPVPPSIPASRLPPPIPGEMADGKTTSLGSNTTGKQPPPLPT